MRGEVRAPAALVEAAQANACRWCVPVVKVLGPVAGAWRVEIYHREKCRLLLAMQADPTGAGELLASEDFEVRMAELGFPGVTFDVPDHLPDELDQPS